MNTATQHTISLPATVTEHVLTTNFQYDDETIEVLIATAHDEHDRNGYLELETAARLLAPYVRIRGFSQAVLWTNVIPPQRCIHNNKKYVHVFALCRYLADYDLVSNHSPQYIILKQLISDLIMGSQGQIVDPLADIKTQLCTLRECLDGGGSGTTTTATSIPYETSMSSNYLIEYRDVLRAENASLLANINASLEIIKNNQLDLANKLAFSNDAMLDSFKSVKDIIIRKK